MVAFALTDAGYEVRAANCVQQALHFAASENFDLCLSDINLPDDTGLFLAGKLRENQPQIKILFCTGALEDAKAQGIKRLGDGFLNKPFELAELLQKIKLFLKSS